MSKKTKNITNRVTIVLLVGILTANLTELGSRYLEKYSHSTKVEQLDQEEQKAQKNEADKELDEKAIIFGKSNDASQLIAWRQNKKGNCSAIAAIKALIDAVGQDSAFLSIVLKSDQYSVHLHDGSKIEVTKREVKLTGRESDFVDLNNPGDVEFANFCLAIMAKNKQVQLGINDFSAALESLNRGDFPMNSLKWIGIPENWIVDITAKDISSFDSIVAWDQRHAVFVDRLDSSRHAFDFYGVPNLYQPRPIFQRTRWGRRYSIFQPYPNRIAIVPPSN